MKFNEKIHFLLQYVNYKNITNPNLILITIVLVGYSLIGFIDDNINSWNRIINGYQIIGGMDLLETLPLDTYVVIAIANYNVKKKIVNKINNKFNKKIFSIIKYYLLFCYILFNIKEDI